MAIVLSFSYKEFYQSQTHYPLNKVVFSIETLTRIVNPALLARHLAAPITYRLLGQGGQIYNTADLRSFCFGR